MKQCLKSGTKPTAPISQNEFYESKTLLTSLIEKTEIDFMKGIFVSYNERTTGTGFHVASIQDAFKCNNYHEGLHLGFSGKKRFTVYTVYEILPFIIFLPMVFLECII